MCSGDAAVEAESRTILDDLRRNDLEIRERLPKCLVPGHDLIYSL